MKRIIFALAILLIVIFVVSCAKKEENVQTDPTPTPAIAESDDVNSSGDSQSSDVAQSSDVVASDDTADSDETDEYTLDGAWASEDFGRIFSFMPNENECVYIANNKNYTSDYTYDEETLHISYTNERFIVSELSKSTLVMIDESGNELKFTKLSLTKRLKSVTADDVTGEWTCRIEDNANEAYFEITLTLNADSTATVRTATASKAEFVKGLTWSISKGKLAIDNDSGSKNSKLIFSILSKMDDDTYIMAF